MYDIIKYNVDRRKKPVTNLKGLLNYLDRAGRYFDKEVREQLKRPYPHNKANPVHQSKAMLLSSMSEKVQQIIEQMEDK